MTVSEHQCWKCVYFQRLEARSGDCVMHDRMVQATTEATRCLSYKLNPLDIWLDPRNRSNEHV